MSSTAVPVSVLIIEDEPAIRRLMLAAFEGTAFRAVEAATVVEGTEIMTRKRPDLVLLDLELPDGDGIEVIKRFRGWSNVPILIVSGHGDEERKVQALEAGADDFVTKPFGVNELIARMRAALRRAEPGNSEQTSPVLEIGPLQINRNTREVRVSGERVHLTPIEYKLLNLLASHEGRVLTHRQILSQVWGEEYSEESTYVRIYIGYLRKKLEANPEEPRLLLTEPRIGYRLGS